MERVIGQITLGDGSPEQAAARTKQLVGAQPHRDTHPARTTGASAAATRHSRAHRDERSFHLQQLRILRDRHSAPGHPAAPAGAGGADLEAHDPPQPGAPRRCRQPRVPPSRSACSTPRSPSSPGRSPERPAPCRAEPVALEPEPPPNPIRAYLCERTSTSRSARPGSTILPPPLNPANGCGITPPMPMRRSAARNSRLTRTG